jgi:hypothetical protein
MLITDAVVLFKRGVGAGGLYVVSSISNSSGSFCAIMLRKVGMMRA